MTTIEKTTGLINVHRGATSPASVLEAKMLLDHNIVTPTTTALGSVAVREDIRSSMGPFSIMEGYRVEYPQEVTSALANLYEEYNHAFRPLVAANREWETDYQHIIAADGTPINGAVQIDMVGLPDGFLKAAPTLGEGAVREALRGRIFEIENSLAMYQLLEGLFSNGQDTLFNSQFRASLDEVRQRHGRRIALLAVTDQKHKAMRESEFGKYEGEALTDEEVYALSGFDRFFGPAEFQQHLAENGGQSEYLLYARTSDPLTKLKKPDTVVSIPLLEDPVTRQVIKANALTFNVDTPDMDPDRRINDTKAYLPTMGMGYAASADTDLLSGEFLKHLLNGNAYGEYSVEGRLNPDFVNFLISQGVDPLDVAMGQRALRAKPMKGTYGCYGHLSGGLGEKIFRREFRQSLRIRGSYVIQPEMPTTTIVNETDGKSYTYIDRVFLSTDGANNYRFMGGFRSLMPLDTIEAASGRNHGSKFTVWGEIV